MTRRAIFPGSFDPFTLGHADIVRRGLELCDSLVIAVGYNEHKQGWIPVEERVRALQEFYGKDKRTGIEYGINRYGMLYLGDNKSGYNLYDTTENRERILRDFERYTK